MQPASLSKQCPITNCIWKGVPHKALAQFPCIVGVRLRSAIAFSPMIASFQPEEGIGQRESRTVANVEIFYYSPFDNAARVDRMHSW